jgi:hypothetical protein
MWKTFFFMSLRVIWQYMDRSVIKKILYGPQKLRSIHIIFVWWWTGSYTAIWPSVPWTICYLILGIAKTQLTPDIQKVIYQYIQHHKNKQVKITYTYLYNSFSVNNASTNMAYLSELIWTHVLLVPVDSRSKFSVNTAYQ